MAYASSSLSHGYIRKKKLNVLLTRNEKFTRELQNYSNYRENQFEFRGDFSIRFMVYPYLHILTP